MSSRAGTAAAAVLTLACVPAAAQQPDTSRLVGDIRVWYGEVQGALDTYRFVEREYTSGGGGGVLTLYQDGDAPRKLVVRFDGDGLSWTREYFFRDGALFFVFSRSETFPIWPDQPPEEFGVTEERNYVADGRMIRWLVSDQREGMRRRSVPPRDEPWSLVEAALLEDAANWLAFARTEEPDFDAFLDRRP